MLKFETDVRLYSTAPPEEVEARLQLLTAPARFFESEDSVKPFRGRFPPGEFFLRWPRRQGRPGAARLLRFELLPSGKGTVLTGRFVLPRTVRYPALIWVTCGLLFWTYRLLYDLVHHGASHLIVGDIVPMAIGIVMVTIYLWVGSWWSRPKDEQMIRTLRVALESEEGAIIAANLLAVPTSFKQNYVDPTPDDGLFRPL